MAIKDRLIQFILRGKDELSPEAKKAAEAIEALGEESTRLGQALDSAKDTQGLVNSLKNTSRVVEQTERRLVQADLQIRELRDALSAAPGSEGLQQSLKDAEREAGRTRRQLIALKDTLKDQEQAAKAAGIDTAALANEEERLAKTVTDTKAALAANVVQLRELKKEQAAAARAAAEHTSRVAAAREAMTSGARQIVGYAAAYLSLNAAFGLVQKGLNVIRDGIYSMLGTGDQFELLGKRLTSLMGSVEGGEKAVAWIKQFAKDTPLEVADVTDAFALLKSYGLDPMNGTLQAVVDKNEQLGGGMERLTGIASALGQAYAKQKLQTEEILQLVERGVPVWGLLEKVTGKNAAQLQDLATKGKLGRDVIKALIAEIGTSAKGAAAANMTTLTGLTSNLSDVWSDFLNRISKAGALDAVKGKLMEVANTIDQMDKDGRLDALAKALSNAFVQGVEWVERFAKSLVKIDFNQLTDNSTSWLNNFTGKLDSAAQSIQLFFAPFRTLFNGLTSGLAGFGVAFTGTWGLMLRAVEAVANKIPDALGGAEVKAAVTSARETLDGLREGLVEQIEQDGADIRAAWDTTAQSGVDAQAKVTAAAVAAEAVKKAAAENTVKRVTELNAQFAASAIEAAASGKTAIVDMANALKLIDTATTKEQLTGLRSALVAAYGDGKLSQEEFANATAILNTKLKGLGSAASEASDGVSDLEEKLGDLKSVQAAISNAKTSVDINNINAALRKLYNEGTITATQYNDAVQKVSARQKELKQAVDEGRKSQDAKNDSDREAIKTSAELRKESGERMAAERQAGDQAMEDRRRGTESAKKDMGAMGDFFSGVLTRAREPLAQMSEAALQAFDKLQGITTVDLSLDTSGLKETTESLQKAVDALGEMQLAAGAVGASGLGRWMAETAVRSQQLQVQFLKQKQSMQSLLEGYENGDIKLADFTRRAAAARNGLSLLNDSDMRTLEGALDGARQKMEQLQQGSKTTLASLQEELMGLRGETEALERSKFASRRAELQQQIIDAQKSGDSTSLSNLNRAMSTLRQIEDATAQQRQSSDQAKRVDQSETAAAGIQPAAAPSKIIRLEAKGKSVDVAVNDGTDETKLLSILEGAGLRTI